MAIALVASASGSGDTGVTTSPDIDLSTATFLLVGLVFDTSYTPSVSDTSSNTYDASHTTYGASTKVRPIFCASPTVTSAMHAITSAGAPFGAGALSGWTGVHATPYDQQTGDNGSGTSAQASGNLTPSETNCVVLSILALTTAQSAAPTVGAGWTILPSSYKNHVNAVSDGIIMAYQIQTAIVAVNPVWTLDTTGAWSVTNVSFKSTSGVGGGGGGASAHGLGLLGVGQ